jgi:hypothetical protein
MSSDDPLRRILRPGLSGFDGSPDPRWTLQSFRAACHAAARTVGARLVRGEDPGPARNHYRALLELAAGERWILLNAIHPLLAFAIPRTDLRYDFVDEPALAAAFHGPCEPVLAADLTAALDPRAAAPLLGPTEREQAEYWRPARLGDLIFNHWD